MSGARLQNGLTPRQAAIKVVMGQIELNIEPSSLKFTTGQALGAAQLEGIQKELALIHNRLGKRLPEGVDWTPI